MIKYKSSRLIHVTLLHRAFKLCTNFERFHQEIDKLKTIFENNGYPKSFVDLCIKKYLDKVFIKKEISTESLEKRTYLRPSFSWKKVDATENSFS